MFIVSGDCFQIIAINSIHFAYKCRYKAATWLYSHSYSPTAIESLKFIEMNSSYNNKWIAEFDCGKCKHKWSQIREYPNIYCQLENCPKCNRTTTKMSSVSNNLIWFVWFEQFHQIKRERFLFATSSLTYTMANRRIFIGQFSLQNDFYHNTIQIECLWIIINKSLFFYDIWWRKTAWIRLLFIGTIGSCWFPTIIM